MLRKLIRCYMLLQVTQPCIAHERVCHAGSVDARSLLQEQQQQQPTTDSGNVLGNLVNQFTTAAGQIANTFLEPVTNATRQAADQAAVNGSNITAPLTSLTDRLDNLTADITNATSPVNISNPINGTQIGQDITQFFGGITGNISQAGQQFANNVTRTFESVGNGSGIPTQQQQQLTPPWQSSSSSRAAVGALAGLAAGAVMLLQLLP